MQRQKCVGCSISSPETDTEYTLISATHGWRVSRSRAANGDVVFEWRCPGCWRKFKDGSGHIPVEEVKPQPSLTPSDAAEARRFFDRARAALDKLSPKPPR
jgi:hypothetical protein